MHETTVLLSTFNCGKYIKDAINSILKQSYKDYEILIIDDGSTDQTESIINQYKNIRYYKNEDNIGISASLNRGIELAKGEFIARMDADDIMLGNRLYDQVSFLKKNPDYGMVGGWYHIINEQGSFQKTMTPYTTNEQIKLGLLFRNQFAQPAVTGRTKLFKDLRYDVNFKCAEDYDLWIRFAKVSKIANLPNIYLSYRWHANNTCNTKQTELRLSILNLFSRELDKLHISHDEHELMLHLAVSFGMGQYLIKDQLKRRKLLNWYNKVFSSPYLAEQYSKDWLLSFKNDFLKSYCGIIC